MIGTSIPKRLGRLEALGHWQPNGDDGHTYSVDIGSDTPLYRIDGQVVTDTEFLRRCPTGGYTVDIGVEEHGHVI